MNLSAKQLWEATIPFPPGWWSLKEFFDKPQANPEFRRLLIMQTLACWEEHKSEVRADSSVPLHSWKYLDKEGNSHEYNPKIWEELTNGL